MTDNYTSIVRNNLDTLYADIPPDLAQTLPGEQEGDTFRFTAFGQKCTISPDTILLGDTVQNPVFGILISLYALNARPDTCIPEPFKAFKEFPDSLPYAGAFMTHTEQLLVPHVPGIKASSHKIMGALDGQAAPEDSPGDFSFVVYPLPKIALCYIFYEADEDFPASVTCLFSSNARLFLPVDGLADVGEYCSKTIIQLATP
jgi:hypothetical protein